MQDTPNSEVGKEILLAIGIVFVLFFVAMSYYGNISSLLDAIENFKFNISNFFSFNWILDFFKNTQVSQIFLIISAILLSIFIVFFIFRIMFYLIKGFVNVVRSYVEEKQFIANIRSQIETIFETGVKSDLNGLKGEIEKVKELIAISRDNKKLNCFTSELKKRLKTCLELLEELKKKTLAEDLKKEIESSERRIEELDDEIRIKETYDDPDDYVIYRNLRADEKRVFKKSQISKRQAKALRKFGFVEKNEYSMIEHKYIRYLICPSSNHTPTHAFLVWEIQKILKTIEGVTKIKEHLAVNADVTFKFRNRYHAIEVERGDLLRKKDQINIKLDYLNKNYRKRWMFLISNKNHLSKYQKFGFSTQRSRVLHNLKKLLKIS